MRRYPDPLLRTALLTATTLAVICCGTGANAKEKAASSDDNKPTPPDPPVTTDLVNGGTLIAHGITIGGGVEASFGSVLDQTMPTFMPYVALFPGAWAVHGDISKAYCTGRFIKGPAAAKAYADSVADYVTRKKLKKSEGDEVTNQQVEAVTGWDKSSDGRCGLFTWVGVYVGKPSSMRVNSTYAGSMQPRDFTSYVSVGLISSPIAYFSGFAGVTLWSYEDTDAKLNRNTTTFTVGLGTNLDVLSQFFN